MRRRGRVAGAASALLGLALLSGPGAMAESRPPLPVLVAPLPVPRPADMAVAPPHPPPTDVQAAPAASSCHAALTALGIRFAPEPAPTAGPACLVTDPVRLEAIGIDGGEIRWPDRPLVGCAFARVLGEFTRDLAQPLARSLVGRPLAAFGTGGGFECRGRNRASGGRVSAHGTGRAVDIAWFAFEGDRREPVGTPGGEDGRRFVGALRKAACGWFTTVLGPGSDAAHADHLHLDREPRGRDGESRLCQ
jgi:hypothetical protein